MILPLAVESIEDDAFANAAVPVVYIDDQCRSIGAGAFRECANLRVIRIPGDCSVGREAFEGCCDLLIYSARGSEAERHVAEHNNCLFIEE